MRSHSHPDTSELPVVCDFFLYVCVFVFMLFFIVCLICQAQYFTAMFAKCVFGGDSKLILIHSIPFQVYRTQLELL